ncbi:hypothetical protein SAMN05428959_101730 [Duganella sp. CF517]|uniref:hypothetical protein n=1 Tax=Duganella sp. CF517 TaxID=1881038 RepID=UPI0008CFD7C6|nr:hypothetical protein [Duganella sp. CF517]SEN22169.1 hypothetical protein SAMN05428959_101730 [Duganella sp. CF517]
MSTLSALGARALPASYTAATPQTDGKTTGTPATQKSNSAASSPLSLSSNALDMQKRVASIGTSTVDFAEDLMNSFTQALFGDAAKGATIDYDSASLDASSSYALGVRQSSGPDGTRSLAAFSLNDSAHFIGKGTITTADGRKFDFEVEVKYDYRLDAAASQASGGAPKADQAGNNASERAADRAGDNAADKPQTVDLPSVRLPNIDFAGTLADLFELIGRDLQTALATTGDDGSQTGDGVDRNALRSLSLRLLNLVDSREANTYIAPTQADQAKSAAAYGGQAGAADKVTGGPSGIVDAALEAAKPAAVPAADADAAPADTVAADDGKGAAAGAS